MLDGYRNFVAWYNERLPGNFVNLLYFVLGIIASIAVWWFTRDYKEISVWQSQTPVVVFDSTNTSPKLTLLDDQSQPITRTVYIDSLRIWNSGTEAITQADIREPIRISISPVSRVVDAVVVGANPQVASFHLVPLTMTNTSSAYVQLDWDYFDPDFGVTAQIIYESDERATVKVLGHIYGIAPNEFRNRDELTTTMAVIENPFPYISIIALIIGSIFLVRYLEKLEINLLNKNFEQLGKGITDPTGLSIMNTAKRTLIRRGHLYKDEIDKLVTIYPENTPEREERINEAKRLIDDSPPMLVTGTIKPGIYIIAVAFLYGGIRTLFGIYENWRSGPPPGI